MQQITTFFKNCRDLTGVFPIVVLTFKTSGNYSEAEKMFKCLGAEVVVAVENYSEEDQIQTLERSRDFLNLIKSALDNVTFRMGNPRNPREERIKRKKFLLRYVHDIDMEEKRKQEEYRRRFMDRKRFEARRSFFARKREEAMRKREARKEEEARNRAEEARRREEEAREREVARRRQEEARERGG
ncbi:vicilin-like seed storage protein At2g18540 [Xenopus tropicalis]|uniref:Vicilin-like seed storage protein At2g18540 n=1 Tax=Xenopus tropicalis TaxID=8364 RepID=A0A8J1IUI2_XENTR|nr:vicilin-like seed storage protein At2g18540 [Xenopus tropicalis]